MEILGDGGSTMKPPGTENPLGVGFKLEKSKESDGQCV